MKPSSVTLKWNCLNCTFRLCVLFIDVTSLLSCPFLRMKLMVRFTLSGLTNQVRLSDWCLVTVCDLVRSIGKRTLLCCANDRWGSYNYNVLVFPGSTTNIKSGVKHKSWPCIKDSVCDWLVCILYVLKWRGSVLNLWWHVSPVKFTSLWNKTGNNQSLERQ